MDWNRRPAAPRTAIVRTIPALISTVSVVCTADPGLARPVALTGPSAPAPSTALPPLPALTATPPVLSIATPVMALRAGPHRGPECLGRLGSRDRPIRAGHRHRRCSGDRRDRAEEPGRADQHPA